MFKPLNDQIICKDGTTVSIQASEYHYCVPREDTEAPTETVYGYVPIEIVEEFISIHGGIEKGEMPK